MHDACELANQARQGLVMDGQQGIAKKEFLTPSYTVFNLQKPDQ